MRPKKTGEARVPFRPPPSRAELEQRGLDMMKTKRVTGEEDGDEAYERAMTMPWAGRIVEKRPYSASGFWIWLVRNDNKETK